MLTVYGSSVVVWFEGCVHACVCACIRAYGEPGRHVCHLGHRRWLSTFLWFVAGMLKPSLL